MTRIEELKARLANIETAKAQLAFEAADIKARIRAAMKDGNGPKGDSP